MARVRSAPAVSRPSYATSGPGTKPSMRIERAASGCQGCHLGVAEQGAQPALAAVEAGAVVGAHDAAAGREVQGLDHHGKAQARARQGRSTRPASGPASTGTSAKRGWGRPAPRSRWRRRCLLPASSAASTGLYGRPMRAAARAAMMAVCSSVGTMPARGPGRVQLGNGRGRGVRVAEVEGERPGYRSTARPARGSNRCRARRARPGARPRPRSRRRDRRAWRSRAARPGRLRVGRVLHRVARLLTVSSSPPRPASPPSSASPFGRLGFGPGRIRDVRGRPRPWAPGAPSRACSARPHPRSRPRPWPPRCGAGPDPRACAGCVARCGPGTRARCP